MLKIEFLPTGSEIEFEKFACWTMLIDKIMCSFRIDPLAIKISIELQGKSYVLREKTYPQIMHLKQDLQLKVEKISQERDYFAELFWYYFESGRIFTDKLRLNFISVLRGNEGIDSVDLSAVPNSQRTHYKYLLQYVKVRYEFNVSERTGLGMYAEEGRSSSIFGPRCGHTRRRLNLLSDFIVKGDLLLNEVNHFPGILMSSITVLNLAGGVPNGYMHPLFIELSRMSLLEVLNVSDNRITQLEFEILEKTMNAELKRLRVLEVKNCSLKAEYFDMIVYQGFFPCYISNLTVLNLRGNFLTGPGFNKITAVIGSGKKLEVLDLSACSLNSQEMEALRFELSTLISLKTIHLSENSLSNHVYSVLLESLQKLPNLQLIDMGWNKGTYSFTNHNMESLPLNISVLDLSESTCTGDSVRIMVQYPEALSKLRALYLGNLITPQGLKLNTNVFSFLKYCINLEDFGVTVDSDSLSKGVVKYISRIPKAKRLSLSGLILDDDLVRSFVKSMNLLGDLEHLFIDNIKSGDAGFRYMAGTLFSTLSLKLISFDICAIPLSKQWFIHRTVILRKEIYITGKFIKIQGIEELEVGSGQRCNICGNCCKFPDICQWGRIRNLILTRHQIMKLRLI